MSLPFSVVRVKNLGVQTEASVDRNGIQMAVKFNFRVHDVVACRTPASDDHAPATPACREV